MNNAKVGWVYNKGKWTGLLAYPITGEKYAFRLDNVVMFNMVKPDVRIVFGGKAFYINTWRQNGMINYIDARCYPSDDHLSKASILMQDLRDG